MSDQQKLTGVSSVEGENSTLDIHHAVMRETADPNEAYDPGPRWFYALAVAAIAIGGFYLGRHFGAFDTTAHIGYLAPGAPVSTAAGPSNKIPVSGAVIYTGKCASCHQASGIGLPGAFPPLVGSPYVVGDPTVPIRIVLQGLHGPLTVEGKSYNGVMPAWAEQLKDDEIAAVITHIRTQLGSNKAAPVDVAMVTKLRKETASRILPWTVDELSQPGGGK